MTINKNTPHENYLFNQILEETYTPDQHAEDITGDRDSISKIEAMNNLEYYQDLNNMPNRHLYDKNYLKHAHDANGGNDTTETQSEDKAQNNLHSNS